ncbi:MAG TPA: prepilin-type N-terminal cleavage/methylation domain-containing protein [Solirubrobacteraceae bacterium]|jgi:prepilin-type N-terminal cleavage/methylation domain-containing protein|nr:prepilin-type N-terminal cleavage/methylation domain-containing protein [Solirubrobacteraceae bacterium]
MLTPLRRACSRLLREERGLTLIELLVSMTAGAVVVAGATLVLVVALRQNTRVIDAVQADSIGRTASNQIVDELRSSCTGFGSSSIQAPSTTPTSPLVATGGLSLWFLTAYGSSTSGEAAIKRVTLHDIAWSSTGTSNTKEALGKLTDYSWNSTGGEPPNSAWSFNSVLSPSTANVTRVVATNVIPAEASKIFSYEKYDTTAADEAYGTLVPLLASELPPSAVTAKRIARVTIAYTQAPERGDTRAGHTASFRNSVVLRLTPPESNSEGSTCA